MYPTSRGAMLAIASLAALIGCGEEESTPGGPLPGTGAGGQGGTTTTVAPPCADELVPAGDGSCLRPGIPADACGEGFEPVDGGCQPLLPLVDCEPGTLAIPGETTCREVAPCADGTWGDIPAGPEDEHVDASYTGGASDGSTAHPWTTIQSAVDAAAPGAIVAVAAGSYAEDLFIHAKTGLQIWGRCPSLVSVSGVVGTEQPSAVFITDEAPATTLRALAITGPKKGLTTIAEETSLAEIWLHDTAEQGIFAVDSYGPSASITISDSLIEATHRTAVFVAGSDLTIERSVIRDTLGDDDGVFGRGLYVDRSTRDDATEATTSAALELRRSVLRRNRLEALRIDGADAIVEDTAILETLGQESDGDGGIGLSAVWHLETGARSRVTVARTTVRRSQSAGVLVVGSDVTLDAVVIEETRPLPSGRYGRGIEVQGDVVASVVTVQRTLLQDNVGAGALVGAADVTFESTIVRRTSPEQDGPFAGQFGFGISAQASPDFTRPAQLTVRRCLVTDNHVAGVSVFGGQLTLESSRVERTEPAAGLFGDGVLVYNYQGCPSSGAVSGSVIADNARAGAAVLGSAVTVAASLLTCNAVDLDGETTFESQFSLLDEGDNWCGCDVAVVCQVVSSALSAPDPM